MAIGDRREALRVSDLRQRQREHWEQAQAVRDGRQPRIDPDGTELDQIGENLRVYRLHEIEGVIDHHPALIYQRLVKQLAASGTWESEFVLDSYRPIE